MIDKQEKRYRNIIGQNVIWYRLRSGYTQENLADIIGCKQQTINSIEKGRIKRSKYLPYIAKALNVNIADLDPDLKEDSGPIIPQTTSNSQQNTKLYPVLNDFSKDNSNNNTTNYLNKINSDVPIFGTQEAIKHYFTVTKTPVEFLPRPHLVNLEKDAFGIIIGTQIMLPLFRIGDIIIIHPRKTPKEQDICLFIGYENSITIYTIAELVHEDFLSWTIKHYHSYDTCSLSKTIWKKCHCIVAKYFR